MFFLLAVADIFRLQAILNVRDGGQLDREVEGEQIYRIYF